MPPISNVSFVPQYTPTSATVSGASREQSTAPVALASKLNSAPARSSSPLTYNAAGLINAFEPANKSTTSSVSQQAAQQAAIEAQSAINQTLNSLMSGSFVAGQYTNIFGLNSATTTPTGKSTRTAQAAQNAYITAQDAVTKAQIFS
ncbi:MAG: hypothetical protein R8K48_06330 [Gallionella sp.]